MLNTTLANGETRRPHAGAAKEAPVLQDEQSARHAFPLQKKARSTASRLACPDLAAISAPLPRLRHKRRGTILLCAAGHGGVLAGPSEGRHSAFPSTHFSPDLVARATRRRCGCGRGVDDGEGIAAHYVEPAEANASVGRASTCAATASASSSAVEGWWEMRASTPTGVPAFLLLWPRSERAFRRAGKAECLPSEGLSVCPNPTAHSAPLPWRWALAAAARRLPARLSTTQPPTQPRSSRSLPWPLRTPGRRSRRARLPTPCPVRCLLLRSLRPRRRSSPHTMHCHLRNGGLSRFRVLPEGVRTLPDGKADLAVRNEWDFRSGTGP